MKTNPPAIYIGLIAVPLIAIVVLIKHQELENQRKEYQEATQIEHRIWQQKNPGITISVAEFEKLKRNGRIKGV